MVSNGVLFGSEKTVAENDRLIDWLEMIVLTGCVLKLQTTITLSELLLWHISRKKRSFVVAASTTALLLPLRLLVKY